MKKLTFAACFLASVLTAKAQQKNTDSAYESKKLTLEEANFVSSYYNQDGNNSAVTGGVGTEKLIDFGNVFELRFLKLDNRSRQHRFSLEFGVDAYTSASSGKIGDPNVTSHPSKTDKRIYPSLGWSVKNEENRTSFGATASYSTEYDYQSFGGGLNFSKTSRDNNREFSAKGTAFFDTWRVIYPYELQAVIRWPDGSFYGTGSKSDPSPISHTPRNSFSTSFSLAQVVNKRTQVLFLIDPAYQQGLLATKYQRVYFNDAATTLKSETLPDTRFKLPVGVRLNYFWGDNLVLRSFYRYYQDNWGVKAHTLSLETAYKLSPFTTVSPYYRFYSQTASDYFAPYKQHSLAEQYFTSDYDLSKFTSHSVGTSIRFVPKDGVLGMRAFNSLELRYGFYYRNTNTPTALASNVVTLMAKFK